MFPFSIVQPSGKKVFASFVMIRAVKFTVALGLTALLAYFLVVRFPQIRQNVALRDSVAYWAAGHLLISHQDPYEHEAVLRLEQVEGYRDDRPLVLRTPPWSLFMVAPLGLLKPLWAWAAWIALSLLCLIVGIRLCRELYGRGTPPNLFAVITYTFAPVPACLISGQMGLVLMFGVILFFWWERDRPALAGAALVIPFAKPHLLGLFWLVLVLWVVQRRRGALTVGFFVALLAASAFAVLMEPSIFRHYRHMLSTASIGNEFIPALSGVLRLLFFRRMFWTQFVPMTIGLIWCLRFFLRNSPCWNWREHGPPLLVVSVLTTPYEWLSDETVLLPAILQAAAFVYASRNHLKIRTKLALMIFALLDLLLLLILKSKIPFSTGIYFWSSLVWFFWYFHARNLRGQFKATATS
jgi:hypothetical protein